MHQVGDVHAAFVFGDQDRAVADHVVDALERNCRDAPTVRGIRPRRREQIRPTHRHPCFADVQHVVSMHAYVGAGGHRPGLARAQVDGHERGVASVGQQHVVAVQTGQHLGTAWLLPEGAQRQLLRRSRGRWQGVQFDELPDRLAECVIPFSPATRAFMQANPGIDLIWQGFA